MYKFNNITTIAFDADDTLWENENNYRDTETEFCKLLKDFGNPEFVSSELLKTEISNIEIYGYGAKSFTLSMIETAIRISNGNCGTEIISKIIEASKELINMPVKLLPDVENTLAILSKKYKLILATKGDLLDQERKLNNSGLAKYFEHVEIMSNKRKEDYVNLINKLKIKPTEFMMVGNTIKSDVLPVIEAGATAIHIPYHITWDHEKSEHNQTFLSLEHINQLIFLSDNQV
ncbi:MAG: HAD family hydrolase [Bacteroidales bacterium]|nr:HAD family hydrolase [Bacteroidales bacterium]